jgi:2-keto-4-pentenoate hydratase
VVGYKAGLTNPAVQKRFNFNAPVRGTLFESMILRDAGQGVDVAAKFGARPLFEADLVVEVADSGVHNATTPAEVLQYVSRIYPFMELPDLVVDDPSKLGGAQIVAINVGARLGVLGPPIAVQAAEALSERLRTMTIKLADGSGKLLDEGKGSAILEHPLNAVIWLAKDLKANGITLKPGDLLSLGSFSRLLPPQSGQTVSAVYEGLNADATAARVTVRFK